jgi:asparagine synthase (glutamine-hydrolysing)
MCGIAGVFGTGWSSRMLGAMVDIQQHRGPDDRGVYVSPCGTAGLGQRRLSIIDLSSAGHQPMQSVSGDLWITFNGEIYNYVELRKELSGYPFRTATDTEVILAAFERWGADCLNHLRGMFAFMIWDVRSRKLFAARDRFGVKPLYYSSEAGILRVASEIKALHAGGVPAEPDETTWAAYLGRGYHDHSEATFWKGIRGLPPGHILRWEDGKTQIACWYDLASRLNVDAPAPTVLAAKQTYLDLLKETVALRFRSDVPVGINLSGGLDSSILLALVHHVEGTDSQARAYTFITNDENYDELPWVQQMLAHTRHPLVTCALSAEEVPALAASVQQFEDEPFGGLPTVAYAKLFEMARADGTRVLLDGQGMDEQWAGYDYYTAQPAAGTIRVQGSQDRPVRPECLTPEFRSLSQPVEYPQPFKDALRNLQYRDLRYTKIPRALRFNDRASMRSSVELREPFLDHTLVEFAFTMPLEFKIHEGTRKWLLRQIAADLVPSSVAEAPKRPLQTPQREWLRGPLKKWAEEMIEAALTHAGGTWVDARAVRSSWKSYCAGESDNSFYVWQWISLGLLAPRFTGIPQNV